MDLLKQIELTKNILEKSNNILEEKNQKYYTDVVDFLNLLFEDDSKSLLKIKFKKITLNENVFKMYNEINKIYELKKPEFNIDKFNIDNIDDPNDIKELFYDIAYKLSNNLLEKLNYKIAKKKDENKIKFFLIKK